MGDNVEITNLFRSRNPVLTVDSIPTRKTINPISRIETPVTENPQLSILQRERDTQREIQQFQPRDLSELEATLNPIDRSLANPIQIEAGPAEPIPRTDFIFSKPSTDADPIPLSDEMIAYLESLPPSPDDQPPTQFLSTPTGTDTPLPAGSSDTPLPALGEDELIASDAFGPAIPPTFTYKRQEAIKRFKLRDHVIKNRQKMSLRDKGFAPPDSADLLTTNNLDPSFTTENSVGTLPTNRKDDRYYQEVYRLISINSRQRQKFNERPVVASDRDCFPNKEIWDEFFNPDSNEFDADLCCLTFNNILGFDQEFPYFFIKEGQLWTRTPKDINSNEYTIDLNPIPRHIRYIRLRSVEIPSRINHVNSLNNLMLLDVIDPCTGQSFEYPEDLPFAVLLIPIGNYTVPSLLEAIIAELNKVVCDCDPFSSVYNFQTGEVTINSEYQFHLKFWFSTTHPQFNLWEMLGFSHPFPIDEEGNPQYTNSFSNLTEQSSPLTNLGLTNTVPFRRPNLDVHEYVYLSIDKLDNIQDPGFTGGDIFAKVSLRNTENNQPIPTTKVYITPLESLPSIKVRWLDAYGNLVDFQGQENSFLLEIVEYQDKLKETDFSTIRGLHNFDPDVARVVYKINPS